MNLSMRLMVQDFDVCFQFYAEIMGLKVTWGKKGDVYASFKGEGGALLSIFQAELMDSHIGCFPANRNAITDKLMLVFETQDVDAEYQQLCRRGAQCMNTPHDMPEWGMRCLHLRDPEGNLIELFTELPRDEWSSDLQEDAKLYE